MRVGCLCAILLVLSPTVGLGRGLPEASPARWTLDIETGAVRSGYNDVRIPGDVGVKFSFSDDLETDPAPFVRLCAELRLNERHSLDLLVAPLRLHAEGSVPREVRFHEAVFPAGAPLEGDYRFDSYRLRYRYGLMRAENLTGEVGLTAKVRDAAIRVRGGGKDSEKSNTGFVPLLNFRLLWTFSDPFGFQLEGDALAAPQGRAEDVMGSLLFDVNPRLTVRAGYRLLEGGADNDEVYNFTLIHYAAVGASIRL